MVGAKKVVPNVASPPLQKQEFLDYSRGLNTYTHNDIVPENQLVYISDSRISTLGRMKTRQGCDFFSIPAGETNDKNQASVTGAADQPITTTSWLAAKFTAATTGRLTRLDLNLKNTNSGTGALIVDLYSDAAGSPGSLLGQSSIQSSSITGAYSYLAARFIEAPSMASGTAYWIVAYLQDDGTNNYNWSATTNATTAKRSANSGSSWLATSFDLNYKTYVSSDGGVKGMYRAYKSDGTKAQLMAQLTTLYSVNDSTGVLTSIKTGLNAGATNYRFEVANNIVYYVNGQDGPRKWDFTTEAANPGTTTVSSNLILHKDQIFYVDSTNPTRLYFTDKTSFETFTSTNFLYVPTPQSADPITGLEELNDNLYIYTRKTKWVLQGSDLSSFVLRRAPGQKGTFSQETVVADRNYMWFLADDGMYQSDGTNDKIISADITDIINSIADKDLCSVAINQQRVYLFYPESGQPAANRCLVWNLNYHSWESNDTTTYIGRNSVWRGAPDNGEFLQGSNLVGAIYYAERSSNLYNNLGHNINWEIRTKYEHFNNPAALKRIKRWYPRFASSPGNFTVFAQYDKGFANSPTTQDFIFLRGAGSLWGGGGTWGSGLTWGTTSFINPRESIPGTAQYTQIRYQRFGVNMPCEFEGHTLYYQVRRPK